MEIYMQNYGIVPDTIEAVRKVYGLEKPGEMEQAVAILDEWIQTQTHFMKKDFRKDYLERMIIANKGSVERTKARLDRLLTLRTMMPKYFKDIDARCEFECTRDIITYVCFPKLTIDYERVWYCQVVGKKFSSKLFHTAYRYCLLMSEYGRIFDYAKSFHLVLDYLNIGIKEVLAALDPIDLRNVIYIVVEGYAVRVASVHIIAKSAFLDVVLPLAKQLVSEKIRKRIHLHKSYDELYQHLPREVFPKDLGGQEKTVKELDAEWREQLYTAELREHWKEMSSARTDESLRQTDSFNEQYMGMPGTFRSLSVD